MTDLFGEQHRPGMTHPFFVREATRPDASAISALLRCAFEEFEALYTPEAYFSTVLPDSGVIARVEEAPVWVAERESAIIGTVGVISVADSLMARGMAVHPAARGLGVAKGLLRHVENFARQNGYKQLSLYTTPFLTQAIRSYQLSGFSFTGETTRPHGTELLRMTKVLDTDTDNEASQS
jgi:putative acetyltransferase